MGRSRRNPLTRAGDVPCAPELGARQASQRRSRGRKPDLARIGGAYDDPSEALRRVAQLVDPARSARSCRGPCLNAVELAPTDRVLVLAPHPDDEVLGAGALVLAAKRAGAGVRVAYATDGEANTWVQRLVERRARIGPGDRARFAIRRRGEAQAALAVLGVAPGDVEFLALPDAAIVDLVLAEDAGPAARLAGLFARVDPTVLVTPSPDDVHPDHGALGILVRRILRGGGRPPALRAALEFAVHTAPGARRPRADLAWRPTHEETLRLRAALRRHAAPMAWHRGRFLGRVSRPFEFRDGDAARATPAKHPVLTATRDASELTLEVRARPRPGAFGAATLSLLAGPDGGALRSLCVALGVRAGDVDVVRRGSGAVEGRASLERRAGRVIVRVPSSVVASGDAVFAQVSRRFGFFDEAGWLEIGPAVAPHAAAPRATASTRAPRVVAVVPCFNVAGLCGPVLDGLVPRVDAVLAVDDGSTDGTGAVLAAKAAASGGRVEVLTFEVNRGKGAALIAAFERCLASGVFDVVVTVDGDGQHRPEDVPAVAAACAAGAGLAIGARDAFRRMPLRSRIGNTWTSVAVGRLCRGGPRDTQSGLRAHSRDFLAQVVRSVEGHRYETELRILLLALARRVGVVSVPIPTVYIDHNRSSHFRPLRDGLRVWGALASWALFDRGRLDRAAASAAGSGGGAV